jgi:hypothetical protein
MAACNDALTFSCDPYDFGRLCGSLEKFLKEHYKLPTTTEDKKNVIRFLLVVLHEYAEYRVHFLDEKFKDGGIKYLVETGLMTMPEQFDIQYLMYDKKTVDCYRFALLNLESIEIVKRWANEFCDKSDFASAELISLEFSKMIEKRRQLTLLNSICSI